MTWPADLDVLATNKTDQTPMAADHPSLHNAIARAIMAIQQELGTNPSGANFSTVVARLDDLAASVNALGGPGAGAVLQSIANAKGDLLIGLADNVVGILSNGTFGQFLMSVPTSGNGMAWVDGPVPSPAGGTEGRTLQTRATAPSGLAYVRPGEKLWAKGEGLCAGNGTNDKAKIQGLIDIAATATRGTLAFEPGDYGVDCTTGGLTVPQNIGLKIEGALTGMGGGLQHNTRIRRTAGTNHLLSIIGDGVGSTGYANFDIQNMGFHGGGLAGNVIHIVKAANTYMHRVTVQNATGSGIYGDVLWNCGFDRIMFQTLGDSTHAALTVTGTGGTPWQSHTVHFTGGCEWEGNSGIGIFLLGQDSFGGTAINFSDFKMERPNIDVPQIRIDNTHNCNFVNGIVSLGGVPGVTQTQPWVYQLGTVMNTTPNRFTNIHFTSNSGWSPTYGIDQTTGRMKFANCDFVPASGMTANWRIQAAVPNDGAMGRNLTQHGAAGIPTVNDLRTAPRMIDSGIVQKWIGTNTPEGFVTAPMWSEYTRNDGTTPLMYVKASGTGNTGWLKVV